MKAAAQAQEQGSSSRQKSGEEKVSRMALRLSKQA